MNLDKFKSILETIKQQEAERMEQEREQANAQRMANVRYIRKQLAEFLNIFGIEITDGDFLDNTPFVMINGVSVSIAIGKNDLPIVNHMLTGETQYVDLSLTFNGFEVRFNGHLTNTSHYEGLILKFVEAVHLD